MNCAEFEEIVHDLDRPGTRGLEQREHALMHAESCGRCAMLAIENEALDFGLHRMSLQDAERKASPVAEAALLREFRRQKVQAAPRMVRWQIAAIGIAAMLLLALGITLRHEAGSNSGGPTAVTASPTTTGTNVPNAGVNAPPAVGPVTKSAAPEQSNARTAASDADDSEYATAFVSLPYADDLTALDNGAVVRVMLSRSALASLGLPEAEMGGADRVSADLVVSDDGTPQAIRLVSQENFN